MTRAVPLLTALAIMISPAALQAQDAVRAAPVRQTRLQERQRVTGSLRAARTATLAALEDGPLTLIAVKEASAVRKGQVIAAIDTRRLDARIAELDARIAVARAELARHQAQRDDARRQAKAMRAAAEKQAISTRAVERSAAELSVARARFEAAQSSITALQKQRELAEVRREDAALKAPFAGRVIRRHAELGEWVRAGQAIATIISDGPLEAWLDLPERLAGKINKDPRALAITIQALRIQRPAAALRIVPDVRRRARTFSLIAELPNPERLLIPGMSIEAAVPIGAPEPRLTIPEAAILRRGQSAFVFRIRGEPATAERIRIRPLFSVDGQVALASTPELEDGDLVVTEGNERLRSGARVAVTPPAKKPASSSADTAARH